MFRTIMKTAIKIENSQGQPSVGLVIPVYNGREYLEECLDSIANQTFGNFHAVVVDDGSTDGSLEIIEDYCRRDSRFTLISGPHRGVSAARNTGIDTIEEELIGFVDADDALQPNALELMVGIISETGADVCVCGFESGETFVRKDYHKSRPRLFEYEEAMRLALYQKIILNNPWGMLMRRRLLGNSVRFREGIRYEDLDAFYRFYSGASEIAWIPDRLYFYRQRHDSFLHRWSDSRLDVLDVTDRITHYMSEHHPRLVRAARDRKFSAHFNMLALMLSYGIDNSAAIDRCLSVIREERWRTITDPHVRLKNKLGVLASFGGMPLLRILARKATIH